MFIEGRLKTRKRQDSNGVERFSTEIIVDHFIFLDVKAPHSDDGNSVSSNHDDLVDVDEELPF